MALTAADWGIISYYVKLIFSTSDGVVKAEKYYKRKVDYYATGNDISYAISTKKDRAANMIRASSHSEFNYFHDKNYQTAVYLQIFDAVMKKIQYPNHLKTSIDTLSIKETIMPDNQPKAPEVCTTALAFETRDFIFGSLTKNMNRDNFMAAIKKIDDAIELLSPIVNESEAAKQDVERYKKERSQVIEAYDKAFK